MTDRRATRRNETADAAEDKADAAAPRDASKRRNGVRSLDLSGLHGHLGYFLRRAQVFIFQDFIRTLSEIDIRPAQYSVLLVIAANPGLSQSDVSDLLGIERARLVRLLHRIEKRGLVQRLASPVDRRSHSLKLTTAGRTILKRAKALAAIHEGRLLARLGPASHKMMIDVLRDFSLSR